MPPHPTSRFENVAASLGKAVLDALDAAGGGAYAVHYPGDSFDPAGMSEWLELRYLPGASRFHRQVDAGLHGATETVILRVDTKVRREATADAHRHWEISDAVADAFPIGSDVAFKDYVGSSAPFDDIGTLRVEDAERSDAGEAGGLAVARTDIRCRYLRKFAP